MLQSKLFLITGNAGQGKTTITRNLAYALRSFGYDVLIVDGDMQTPKMHHYAGLMLPDRTIQDVLTGKRTIRTAMYKDKAGIKYILSNIKEMQVMHPCKLLDRLKDLAEIVLIDTPTNDRLWYETGAEAIIVTQADFPSILAAHKQSKKLKARNIAISRTYGDYTEMTAKNIEDFTTIPVVGKIPEDRAVHEANHHGYSILQAQPEKQASIAFKQLAANLMNLKYHPPKQKTFLAKLGL